MPVKVVSFALSPARNAAQESRRDHRAADSGLTSAVAIRCGPRPPQRILLRNSWVLWFWGWVKIASGVPSSTI